MVIFVDVLKVLHIALCIAVILGVLFMNQKSEGLSGIMGASSYSTRSAKGMDQGMRRMITWLGAGVVFSCIVLGIIGI
jgi:protein translocase SecG subunit